MSVRERDNRYFIFKYLKNKMLFAKLFDKQHRPKKLCICDLGLHSIILIIHALLVFSFNDN